MRKWEPSPNDAINVAAFRWFANQIENQALEVYATDRMHFAKLEELLRNTLREMGAIRQKAFVAQDENGCPDGWLLCDDGLCKPSCDGIESGSSGSTKR